MHSALHFVCCLTLGLGFHQNLHCLRARWLVLYVSAFVLCGMFRMRHQARAGKHLHRMHLQHEATLLVLRCARERLQHIVITWLLTSPSMIELVVRAQLQGKNRASVRSDRHTCRAKIVYTVTATLVQDRRASSWAGQKRASTTFAVHSRPAEAPQLRQMSDEAPVASWLGCCLPCFPCLAHGRVRVRGVVARNTLMPGSECPAATYIQVRPARRNCL